MYWHEKSQIHIYLHVFTQPLDRKQGVTQGQFSKQSKAGLNCFLSPKLITLPWLSCMCFCYF